jgi:hypothetical protein
MAEIVLLRSDFLLDKYLRHIHIREPSVSKGKPRLNDVLLT